jgi:hypothetical protein
MTGDTERRLRYADSQPPLRGLAASATRTRGLRAGPDPDGLPTLSRRCALSWHCHECRKPAGVSGYIDRRTIPAESVYALINTGRANRCHQGAA